MISKGSDACSSPKKKRRHAGQKAQKVSGPKGFTIVSLRVAASGENFSCRWWKTLSRGRTKQCLLWSREEKEIQEWNEQELPEVLPGHSGGRFPERSTKEAGKEEGEEKQKTRMVEGESGMKSPKK